MSGAAAKDRAVPLLWSRPIPSPLSPLLRPEQHPQIAELFFSSSGRLSRAPFLAAEAVVLALLWLYDRWVQGALRLATGWMVLFVLLFAGCCLVSRRLHDLGRAGWWTGAVWMLFLAAWPTPGWLISSGVIGWGARTLLALIALWLALAPGQRRANRFGPALKDAGRRRLRR